MSAEGRLRASDRAADGRARAYAAELRVRTDRFERAIRAAGVAADERCVEALEEFLFDVRAVYDRMDGGAGDDNVVRLPAPDCDFAEVIDIGRRRPQLTADEFDRLRDPA